MSHSRFLPRLTVTLAALAAGTVPAGGWTQAAPPGPVEAPDFPGAMWSPAAPGNFQPANRPTERPIDMVVIHDIEGTAESAVAWFRNPMARVAAHYVIGGSRVWQQVKERDIGYHAGNSDVNGRSVGIEHEGFAYRPGFFNYDLYETSARLVRDITTRWAIPRDRTHIIAHGEVPHPTDPTKFGGRNQHTDPGPYWDWDYYMVLIRNDARVGALTAPPVIHPGEKVTATAVLLNTGDDPWPVQPGGLKNDAAQARGPVYLGIAPREPVPAPAQSPYYDRDSWTSPRFITPAQGTEDTTPGQPATFAFTLQGPRALGIVAERLRLTKVPIAPRVPVPFGPTLNLAVEVKPWEIEVASRSSGFSAPGWRQETIDGATVTFQKFERHPKAPQEPARWTAALPISGQWEVLVRAPEARRRAKRVVYEVASAQGPQRVEVDPRKATGAWLSLGRFRFEGAKPSAVVTLAPAPGQSGTVAAGEVKLVGPLP